MVDRGGKRLRVFIRTLLVHLFDLLFGLSFPRETQFDQWDISEDGLREPVSAIHATFVIVVASHVNVEVSSAMFSCFGLAFSFFSVFVVVFSTLLLALFALQHRSNMERLEDLFTVPLGQISCVTLSFKLRFLFFDSIVELVVTFDFNFAV